MNKKFKGFTLIEIIVSLGLITIISLYLFPSILSIYKNSSKVKNDSKALFAMQEVLEESKSKDEGKYENLVNGFKIKTKISSYNDNLKLVEVKYSSYKLEVVVKK